MPVVLDVTSRRRECVVILSILDADLHPRFGKVTRNSWGHTGRGSTKERVFFFHASPFFFGGVCVCMLVFFVCVSSSRFTVPTSSLLISKLPTHPIGDASSAVTELPTKILRYVQYA